jgi:16S rRNA (uracil1498-N3)-methyltransferase
MLRALPDLRLDELGVRSLKLPRVEHRAGDPVRVLRRPSARAEELRLIRRLGIDAAVTARRRRGEDEVGDTVGMVTDHVLCDQAAHRSAEHRRGMHSRGIQDGNGVERHRGQRHGPAALGLANPTRVEGDDAMMSGEIRDDRVERRPSSTEPRDQQQGIALAVDDHRKRKAVGGVRGQAGLGHGSTIAGRRCRTMHAAVPRFFIDTAQVAEQRATLTGPDAEHLSRSLRARAGEVIVVVAGGTVEHGMKLDEVTPGRVSGAIIWSRPATGEPRLAVHVLQSVPSQGMDDAIEALVVAGAASIRPVRTTRTVARIDAARAPRRLERWRLIARNAAQLSGRAGPPDVSDMVALHAAVEQLPKGARIVVCAARADAVPIATLEPGPHSTIGLVIGPEGGLDAADFEVLDAAGATYAHLGARTFPCRLAGAVATSLLLVASGDLDGTASLVPS